MTRTISSIVLDGLMHLVVVIDEREHHLNSHLLSRIRKVVFPKDIQTHEEYVTIPYRYFKESVSLTEEGLCITTSSSEISEARYLELKSFYEEDCK